jgi:hypothetical protein
MTDRDSHMHLFVAYPYHKKLMVLDSKYKEDRTVPAAEKILEVIKTLTHDDEWSMEFVKVTQQKNNDCTVFAGMFAWAVIYQLPLNMSAEYSKSFRNHMALTLLQVSLHFRLEPKVCMI